MPLDGMIELTPREMLQHGVEHAVIVRQGVAPRVSGDVAERPRLVSNQNPDHDSFNLRLSGSNA